MRQKLRMHSMDGVRLDNHDTGSSFTFITMALRSLQCIASAVDVVEMGIGAGERLL
jgi:hypothetical protein